MAECEHIFVGVLFVGIFFGILCIIIYDIKIELNSTKNNFREEIREMRNELHTTRNNFREEIPKIQNELEATRNNFHEEIRDMKNELEATRNNFHEEIRDMKKELEATRNNFHEKIRKIQNELEATRKNFHEQIRHMKNELEVTRNNFREEIRERKNELEATKTNSREEMRDINNELEATRNNFSEEVRVIIYEFNEVIHDMKNELDATRGKLYSTFETSAYFGSLLSVQTTKGKFVHDLWKTGSIEFNLSSLHRSVYMSKNKKTISNTIFPSAKAGSGEKSLQRYEGAKADRRISEGEEIRLKFIVRYDFKKACKRSGFIFDVTFCGEEIDMFYYGGYLPHCLSMYATHDTESVYIKFENQQLLKYTYLSPCTEGSTFTFGFDVLLSGVHGAVTFRNLLSGRELYTFNAVNFSEPLTPMFGVFNPEMIECMIILI